jgi:hypothetical protein
LLELRREIQKRDALEGSGDNSDLYNLFHHQHIDKGAARIIAPSDQNLPRHFVPVSDVFVTKFLAFIPKSLPSDITRLMVNAEAREARAQKA